MRAAALAGAVVLAAAVATARPSGASGVSARARLAVCLGSSLKSAQLLVPLFAEGLELSALLLEESDVVVSLAVGVVAGGDGVISELTGVVEGLAQAFNLHLVFGALL